VQGGVSCARNIQIAPIPTPINAKCEFRISQSEIRNPQFSNDSHSHRELLALATRPVSFSASND
jgi:hypothetical protein